MAEFSSQPQPVQNAYQTNPGQDAVVLRETSVGAGTNIFKANKDGVFVGGTSYDDAPLKIDYDGTLTATGATVGGTINATGGTFSGSITVSGNIGVGTGTITVGAGVETIVLNGSNGDLLFKNSGTTVGQLGVSGGTTTLNGNGTDLYIINSGTGAIALTAQSGTVYITSNSADISLSAGDDLIFSSGGDVILDPTGDAYISGANLFVDGEVTADAYNDLAEYFESTKEYASEKIPVGTTVVLDGEKIRPAKDGEQPIGAISKTAGVIMGSHTTSWHKRYKRDDFGEFERDSDGRRVQSEEYDETKAYIPRRDRSEWNVVGLIGKLRIKKGQPVADRWIKLRDVSETVEEWLVR